MTATLFALPDYADEHIRIEGCWLVPAPPGEDYCIELDAEAAITVEDNTLMTSGEF